MNKFYAVLLIIISFGVHADSKKLGLKNLPNIKLEAGNLLQLEQYLKKINAYDNADTFKLDFFCKKVKKKSERLGASNLDCKLINID